MDQTSPPLVCPDTVVADTVTAQDEQLELTVRRQDRSCRVEPDGAIRLGLRYVHGLRTEAGQAVAAVERRPATGSPPLCPKCGSDDESLIEVAGDTRETRTSFCNICSHHWTVPSRAPGRFGSIEDLVRRTGLRRDELATLADIGALNAFTPERRSALRQVERAVRPAGALFDGDAEDQPPRMPEAPAAWRPPAGSVPGGEDAGLQLPARGPCRPFGRWTRASGCRSTTRAAGSRSGPIPWRSAAVISRSGRRVRVAGMVITRQRPGTAKGFVFLTLEDETGISNVIVRPDLFDRDRLLVVGQPFLLVEGVLQRQDGVIAVRAERIEGLRGAASVDPHDVH
jgi:hypothetical protein